MGNRPVVFIAAKGQFIEKHVVDLIKKYHKEARIKHVRSPRVFTTLTGLITLIHQNKNTGPVYVMERDIDPACLTFTSSQGKTFGVISGGPTAVKWFNVRGRRTVTPSDMNPSLAQAIFPPTPLRTEHQTIPQTAVGAAS